MESSRDELTFILSLLKSLMSWYLGSTERGLSEFLKGVSNVLHRGWEFSSYKVELRNQVTQNDFTFQVANMKICIEILPSSY